MTSKIPFFLVALLLIGILAQMPVHAAGEILGSSPAATFNATVPGERNLGQVFTWSIQNVSNRADVTYHFNVYAWRLIGLNYTYYSPAWGRWFTADSRPEFQYLAIWVRAWSEGTTCWGYGPDRFNIWAWGNRTIIPEPVHLEDVAVKIGSDHFRPVVIRELENRTLPNGTILTTEWFGWEDGQELTRIEPGTSNAWDGVSLYQVPVAAGPEDLQVAGWFGYFGTPIWYLTPHEIKQKSFEIWLVGQLAELKHQILEGFRQNDRSGARSQG
jgi:hypothetical protein